MIGEASARWARRGRFVTVTFPLRRAGRHWESEFGFRHRQTARERDFKPRFARPASQAPRVQYLSRVFVAVDSSGGKIDQPQNGLAIGHP
jgi:hypothetical protein